VEDARRFDLTPKEAIALQRALAPMVERQDRLGPGGLAAVSALAALDIAFRDGGRTTVAAAVLIRLPALAPAAEAVIERPTRFPYVPGLLSFRELPAGLAALEALGRTPDAVLCDGQGYAHPRRFGLACHLGLALDLPTVGVAKSRLIGSHAEPGPARGDRMPLLDGEEVIGAVLRSRSGVRPLYVSIGHRLSLESALALVLRATGRFRLPEPLRLADRLSKRPRAGGAPPTRRTGS
jgi:deoxyribonuclease V